MYSYIELEKYRMQSDVCKSLPDIEEMSFALCYEMRKRLPTFLRLRVDGRFFFKERVCHTGCTPEVQSRSSACGEG
jgi:hypothetical protein